MEHGWFPRNKGMKRPPLVSILVSTYNRADILIRTIDSILAQTFTDYELIVVDDGSTDETRSVMEGYIKEGGINYVYQENRGVAEARNAGVASSRGEYVAFCDSDDFWVPEKLQKQMSLFTEKTALVYSNAYLLSANFRKEVRSYDLIAPHRGEVYRDLLKKNFIATSSVVVRKVLLNEPFVGTVCEDWKMWLAVARRGLFDFVDEPLIYYYEHSHGLSKSKARLIKSRVEIRKGEYRALDRTSSKDKQLMKEVRFLILKDAVVLKALEALPEPVLKRIDSLYYSSKPIRKLILRMGIGN